MKRKRILKALAILAVAALGLFVSCSGNIMDDFSDTLVYATFDKNNRATSSYTQTVTLKEIKDVYWTYTAIKKDSAGQTGATSTQTAVKKSSFDAGLDGAIGPFSQGEWEFTVYGYTSASTTQPTSGTENTDWVKVGTNQYYSDLIYQGSGNATLSTGTQNNPDPINVMINLLTDGKGTFEISNTSDFHWETSGGKVSEKEESSGKFGATTIIEIDMYLKLIGRKEDNTSRTDYIKLAFVEADAETHTPAYYKIEDGEVVKWENTDAGSFDLTASIVRAEKTTTTTTSYDVSGSSSTSEPTYEDLNVYATSPNLTVKVYVGQTTTLKANVIEENFAYGEFNSVVEGYTEATVTKNVISGVDTIFKSGLTPSAATTRTISANEYTSVKIPSGVKEFESGSVATLEIKAYSVVDANADTTFAVAEGSTEAVVSAIDLTASVTKDSVTKQVSEFRDISGNSVVVLVETYTVKSLTSAKVYHVRGTMDDKAVASEDLVVAAGNWYYNNTTGKLVFATSSFSSFYVSSESDFVETNTNTAYKANSTGKSYTSGEWNFVMLRNVTLNNGQNIYNTGDVTYNLNGKTLSVATPYVAFSVYSDLTVKNGIISGTCENLFKVFNDSTETLGKKKKSTNGSLTLENIKIENLTCGTESNPSAAIYFKEGCADMTLIIKNSQLKVNANYGISTNASYDNYYSATTKGVKIEIENSTVEAERTSDGDSSGLLVNTPDSDVTITNSTVSGQKQGAIFRGGSFTVIDSTFNSDGSKTDYTDDISVSWGDGNRVPLAALVIGNNSTEYAWSTTVTLNGVTLKTENESATRKGFVIYQAESQGSEEEGTRAVSVTGNLSEESAVSYEVGGDPAVCVTFNNIAYVSSYEGITSALESNVSDVELLNKITTTEGTYPNDSNTYKTYAGQSVEWRVLDVDKTNKRLLLISEKVLPLPEGITNTKNADDTYSWAGSGIRTYLNSLEKTGFVDTYGLGSLNIAKVTNKTETYGDYKSSTETDEEIFLLSFTEVATTDDTTNTGTYGDGTTWTEIRGKSMYFSDKEDQVAYDMNNSLAQWWLRSPCPLLGDTYDKSVGFCAIAGNQYSIPTYTFGNSNTQYGAEVGIRPAFWLDLSTGE